MMKMEMKKKIHELQNLIDNSLRHIINRNYYLFDVPYHTNIGDTLIWQGELDYLKTFPYNCLGQSSYESNITPKLSRDSLIIFHGGGNFGDLWTLPHDYKMKIVAENPSCEFLFMPQTVYFNDENNLKKCAEFLSNYNATICARDEVSFQILKSYFKNKILLVPDMAFCIDTTKWRNNNKANKLLLLKRTDKELKQTNYLTIIESQNIEISDWPSIGNTSDLVTKVKSRCRRYAKYIPNLYDWYCQKIYRPYLIRVGVKFISGYHEVYTTRLHGAILSLLLDKQITLLDNSYSKNLHFYETWLKDCDSIIMAEYNDLTT